MAAIPSLATQRDWYCPNCPEVSRTTEARPHVRYHTCWGLRGLSAPMIQVGTKAKVTAHDRDDYVGNEIVPVDAYGRPIMSVRTTRDDGEDVAVFASTATLRA
jgi:hypothetical protein